MAQKIEIEYDAEHACFECANANGYTIEEALRCNSCDLCCRGCPFREEIEER